MRAVLVQFLVDLCRPSQLRTNPFLRGLYFTGVRPVTLTDLAPAAPAPQPQQPAYDADATRVFVGGARAAVAPEALQAPNIRRVPQWVFLSHLFPDVILRDHSALGSSSASVKLNLWRRVLLATAAAVGLIFAAIWIVSFAGNHALESAAVDAARAAQNQNVAPDQLASADSLSRLDDLRQSLATVSDYYRNGRPMHLGWGLFIGDDLYEPLYRIYFGSFRRLLLAPTQSNLMDVMSHPSTQDRFYVYNALKAYLITTSFHDKSTTDFLPAILAVHWRRGRKPDPSQTALADKQFSFYSEELRLKNPYANFTKAEDDPAVQISRAFLKNSATIEPIYQAMLAKAPNQDPPYIFNQQVPGSADVVVNTFPVRGAFLKAGWAYMQKAIQNPDQFKPEPWVLGPDAYKNLDPAKVQQQLQDRYRGEFVKTWRDFLHATRVTHYNSIPDAVAKLNKLSSNQSALLSLLCVVSENTTVDAKPVSDLFQPPQQVDPNPCHDRLSAASNAAYMDSLNRLLSSLQTLAPNLSNDAAHSEAMTSAISALAQVRQMARNFPVDKEGGVDSATQTLLEAPIQYAEDAINGSSLVDANAGARTFCGQLRPLMTKYPFHGTFDSPQATVQEVTQIFKPEDGALWKIFKDTIEKYLVRQGSEYAAKLANPAATPAFVRFFNQAAGISAAFFPNNAKELQLQFSVKVNPSEDVQGLTLSMGSQALNYTGGAGAPQQFAFSPAMPQEIKLKVKFAGGTSFDYPSSTGVWAVFDFFSNFEKWQQTGSTAKIESVAKVNNKPITVNGHPATVSLTLDTGTAPNILRPGYFSNLTCVAVAVAPAAR
jgi:type VI secretion system protein ImpL